MFKNFIKFQSFKTIAKNLDKQTAQNLFELNELIFCGLNLMQLTFLLSKTDPSSACVKVRTHFCTILRLLLPEKTTQIIDIVIKFLRDEVLVKQQEFLAMECLHCLSLSNASCDLIMEKIIDFIEEMIIANRIEEATNACRALYMSVGDNFRDLSANGLTRLLSLYHLSVEKNDANNKLGLFRTGFEITVKKIFKFMSADELLVFVPKALTFTFDNEMRSKAALTDFGLTIQEAFMRLSSADIERNLKPEILEFLLNAMSLKCEVKSFLACRFLTVIIDHLHNFKHFSEPKIYYDGSAQRIRISKDGHEQLVEANHQFIGASLLSAIKAHGIRRNNLNAIYGLVCVMLVTMPSATTHIAIIDMLMDLQACMIDGKHPEFGSFNKNQIHAFIISIMSLICWTTRAKALAKYIRKIVNDRHTLAPHLLPPLRDVYEYEQHHVVGLKSELFLDKWEMRYYLWRLYRIEILCPNRSEFETRKVSGFKFNLFSRKVHNSSQNSDVNK
jgi:hypothetical protein